MMMTTMRMMTMRMIKSRNHMCSVVDVGIAMGVGTVIQSISMHWVLMNVLAKIECQWTCKQGFFVILLLYWR